ncbi:MAG: L-fucose/L-arabinose isomerase family protein [Dysgonamonadaceae bacterium]|nr:L-fucose/L-arabinose isomerase family protein [Dysgonamonadaceae bacterium]MDD3309442.1 L-fucose/L-arabinose isomerase family protein [Dysgonamonadaceae bacterium]MDD3899781.1 L-fucose/L-arabinose isomerase family protein [Dysgonamonadaceae bacterium]MDD4398649.1 L-fucose/L-arabinose isomerase family protein [Dysgonamonadaceae bacterium]
MSKIGLFSVGLDTYWPQFSSLLGKLNGYHDKIKKEIENHQNIEVVDAGMVDNINKAKIVADSFCSNNVELIFLFVSTYALSSTILPIAQKVKKPFIILNLQPEERIDYNKFNALEDYAEKTSLWLEHCQACSIPEIAGVLNKASIKYEIITGFLNDKNVWNEVEDWLDATIVLNALQNNRMGILGNYYGGMLDVYSDLTKHSIIFGTHFEMIEMCELKKIRDNVTDVEIKNKVTEFQEVFDIDKKCSQSEIERAALTSVALDKLVENNQLKSLAYYYEGQEGNDYENIVTSLIAGNTLLTGKNIPVAGECEIKNAHAMKILSAFGAGGSFSEFYLMDFKDDVIYLGHDGPAHFKIAEGCVKLVPLPIYHGKPGNGLSIEMSVKNGPITLLSVVEGNDNIFLLAAEGESVEGPTLEIGNTNSRYAFNCGIREFINTWSKHGPSHHCAVGIGHIAHKIEKLAHLLNISFINISSKTNQLQ